MSRRGSTGATPSTLHIGRWYEVHCKPGHGGAEHSVRGVLVMETRARVTLRDPQSAAWAHHIDKEIITGMEEVQGR